MLNIKDPEAHRLAKELAEIEGTSLTSAVTNALRAALAEHSRRRDSRRQLLTGLMTSARALDLPGGSDLINDLYDPETGMPR